MKRKLLAVVCLLVLICMLPLQGMALKQGNVVRITSPGSLNVRSGPGTDHNKIGTAKPDYIYPYVGTENGWNAIIYTQGQIGYVSGNKSVVEMGFVQDDYSDGPKAEGIVRITHTATLNIRKGPSKEFGVLAIANPNDVYTYVGPDNGWYAIQLNDGSIGFVAANRSEVEILGVYDENGNLIQITPTPTPTPMICGQCHSNTICTTCDGTGVVYGALQRALIYCPSCLGNGKCWNCNGVGWLFYPW